VLAIKVFQDSARARTLHSGRLPIRSVDVSNIDALRETMHDEALVAGGDPSQRALPRSMFILSEIDSQRQTHAGRNAELVVSLSMSAEHPICPICEVPIDRVLAEGCKLSHKVPDLDEVRRRRDTGTGRAGQGKASSRRLTTEAPRHRRRSSRWLDLVPMSFADDCGLRSMLGMVGLTPGTRPGGFSTKLTDSMGC
jgi:hypothetical protein